MIIDAKENRDVAIADVVSAYLLATMDDYVLVKIIGRAVENYVTLVVSTNNT